MIGSGPTTTWAAARQRLAVAAIAMATLTGAGAAMLGASGGHVFGGGAYVVATLAALFAPAAIIVQVISGQLLAASILLAPDGPAPLLLLPVVASVVATAELLAIVGRSATAAPDRDSRDAVRRAVVTVSIAAVVFAVVALIGRLPGPTGILAIALASAACVVLAILLVSDAR